MTPQEAIKILESYKKYTFGDTRHGGIVTVAQIINLLAQPERKTGRWEGTEYDGYADGNPVYYEWKCSECGCIFEEEPTYNYCPNCGSYNGGEG